MLLRYSKDVYLNVESRRGNNADPVNIIFLHGFTGSSEDWAPFFNDIIPIADIFSIDIIGHGKSSSPKDISYYTTKSMVDQLNYVISNLKLERVVLAGYSLGGRVSIAYANSYPDIINGLLLESTSPGIIETDKREQRYESDLELVKMIEEQGISKFIDYWLKLPLFESQNKLAENLLNELRNTKLKNNPVGLANSLRGFSTGIMPHFWNELNNIKCKTLLLTGGLDKKFTEINRNMLKLINNAKHIIVEDSGHNIHIENPEIFLTCLNTFLSEI